MKISDLKEEEIVPGLQYCGLKTGRVYTVIIVDKTDDNFAWTVNSDGELTGFYGNDCECEVYGSIPDFSINKVKLDDNAVELYDRIKEQNP